MEVFIGTIMPFGFTFAPQNWSTCQGQLIPVAQNPALFSLLGATYGGNGQTTFQLPDLQGRAPIGAGNGGGLTPRIAGQRGGAESASLTLNNLPPHTHTAQLNLALEGSVEVSTNTAGNTNAPSATNNYLSASGVGQGSATIWSNTLTDPVSMGGVSVGGNGTVTVGTTGGGQAAPIMNPFLALNFCIALTGLFPPRN